MIRAPHALNREELANLRRVRWDDVAGLAVEDLVATLEALERDLAVVECERDHAYWESCGCLAGGIGHRPGTAGYPCCEDARSGERNG